MSEEHCKKICASIDKLGLVIAIIGISIVMAIG